MQNYQKLFYSYYYAQAPDGECVCVTRKVCFAPAEAPTDFNPYKQRWFYDPDAGYAIRLARTKSGDELGKRNAADLKSEERQQSRQCGCVGKSGEISCPMTCNNCPLNNDCVSNYKAANGAKCHKKCEVCSRSVTRNFELDKPIGNNDESSNAYVDLPDETADILAILEDKELLFALFSALDKLSPDDRELWDCFVKKVKKQDIADRFNLTLDGVYYREKRLKSILRSDETLKSFYTDN